MNEYQVLDNKKKIFGISIAMAIIIFLLSTVVYNTVTKPKKYQEYLQLGNKYLLEGNYEEAILAFEKSIKINSKSTKARILVSKCYIETNKVDIAIDKLKEAQEIDLKNEKLLIEILDIIKNIDGNIADEILQNYIDSVGEENLSDIIIEIINLSNEKPQIPKLNPLPGTYEKPIVLKLELEKIVVGHNYYYTNDGSEPDLNCQRYNGSINIDSDSEIKIIGYNKNGESSDVLIAKYVIDSNIKSQLETSINIAENLYKESTEGEYEYQYKVGSKDILLKEIEKAKEIYNNKLAEKTIIDEGVEILTKAISTFESNQIISYTRDMAKQYVIDKYGEAFDRGGLVQQFYSTAKFDENGYIDGSNKLAKDKNGVYYYMTMVKWDAYNTTITQGHLEFTNLKVYEDGNIEIGDIFYRKFDELKAKRKEDLL